MYSSEEEDDINNKDFNPESNSSSDQSTTTSIPSKLPKKKKSKRNKEYKTLTMYKKSSTKLSLSDDNEYESEDSSVGINKSSHCNHQWVFDQQEIDQPKNVFSSNFLVVIRGNSLKLSKLSYSSMTSKSSHIFDSNIRVRVNTLILFVNDINKNTDIYGP